MWETGADPQTIVDQKGLAQVSDTGAIETAVTTVLDQNAAMVAEYLGGKDKIFNVLVGKVMGAMGGKANPGVVREVLQKALDAKR